MTNRTELIKQGTSNKKRSELLTNHAKDMSNAMNILKKMNFSKKPDELFGRKAIIKVGKNIVIDMETLDFEFSVPYDDDPEANESEIKIFNLTSSTIAKMKWHDEVTISAGYQKDVGIILKGKISKIATTFEGVDKVTILNVVDYQGNSTMALKSIAYKENVKASYIVRDLVKRIGIPLAIFKPKTDYVHKDGVTIEGNLNQALKEQAALCGVSAYINKGQLYIRDLKEGDNIHFKISQDTGLIGKPEYFTEEATLGGKTQILKGYKLKLLLQHRITTASIVELYSNEVKGKFRVRKGVHTMNASDFITEVEVI